MSPELARADDSYFMGGDQTWDHHFQLEANPGQRLMMTQLSLGPVFDLEQLPCHGISKTFRNNLASFLNLTCEATQAGRGPGFAKVQRH